MMDRKSKRFFIVTILLVLLGLVGLTGALAAPAVLTPLATQTSANNPLAADCHSLSAQRFYALSDDLIMDVRNDSPIPFFLTSSTLFWSVLGADGAIDDDAFVNWFSFNGLRYYDGDNYSSPTLVDLPPPGIQLSGGSSAAWRMDIGDYQPPLVLGALATLHLTFQPADGTEACIVSGSLYPIEAELIHPEDGDLSVTRRNQTRFEAEAWETVMGEDNGDGIRRVIFELFAANGNRVYAHHEYLPRYCAFRENTFCNPMSKELWNSLGSGNYMLEVRAEGLNGAWSRLYEQPFVIQK